ncbi:uncharacterized protein BT62DRAFT_195331 [Guyanagaster necrorhizus]|uniref:Uncharacterized protein n=1 Tax=Guyanagaster necrorhizus TaxID=856835 RepID=A0A9P8AT22_9AGAR|nr:uncharacterized protein BT62DRAFT_195331 [Guyanagaster necrorhizus MCA 3950]KAG7445447.1 hypothetical protein BT62DRAFT_195331 [Guyanagaster necrorhizus MCA 3950]
MLALFSRARSYHSVLLLFPNIAPISLRSFHALPPIRDPVFKTSREMSTASQEEKEYTVTLPGPSTLTRNTLLPSDFRDMSHRKYVTTYEGKNIFYAPDPQLGNYASFPKNCKGFLYYWTHPDLPPTSGQIRFRLISTGNPAEFDNGSDLLCPDGKPWQYPLSACVLTGEHAGMFLSLLQKDRLVDDSTIKSKHFGMFQRLNLNKASILLHSIDDAFPISLPKRTVDIHLGERCRMKMVLQEMPWVERLAGPGERVSAHVRLGVSDNGKNRPHLQVIRLFTDKGELDSRLPRIDCKNLMITRTFYSEPPLALNYLLRYIHR